MLATFISMTSSQDYTIVDAVAEKRMIESCLHGDRAAQKQLYDRFAARVWGLVLRYSPQEEDAREVMQEGFIRVFAKLHQFGFRGSFEGWVKRIMIHTALEHYRIRQQMNQPVSLEDHMEAEIQETISGSLHQKDVLKAMQKLAPGFRTVLNLYAIEGYSHAEIAEMLGISESTSKSQLSRARVALWNELKNR